MPPDDTPERELESLRESERRLRAIIEAEPECVKVLAPDGMLLEMNPSGLAMIEAERLTDVLGQSVLSIVAPAYREVFAELTARVLAGETGELEFEIVGLRGTRRWLETHMVPLRDPSGTITAALGITRDISERKRAESALRASQERLRSLAHRLQEVREQERARIARDIHDGIAQTLTALKLDLRWIRDTLNGERPDLASKLDDMTEAVGLTIQDMRRMSTELRPEVLDHLGLAAAIEWAGREFQRRTGIGCRLRAGIHDVALERDAATGLFRIFQEALANVARHAGAASVTITLREQPGAVVLELWDDGRGITEQQRAGTGSLGLLAMRERALLLGGSLDVRGVPGRGTHLSVRIPVSAPTLQRA